MIGREELRFARKVIHKGLVSGEKILECIEIIRFSNYSANLTLLDIIEEKGYLSRKEIKDIQNEINKLEEHIQEITHTKQQTLANYELIEKIGEGAMGVVYKAIDIRNNKIVALKILDEELSEDEEFIKRFLREARNAGKLKKHENIVEAYDFGNKGQIYYFAMEFVDGQSLAHIIYNKRTIKERTALNITLQIAKALSHANKFSIVHRDIKPENILISRQGVLKLCDLGLAKDISRDFYSNSGGITLGTANYTSPEQATGTDIDIRSDLYSLGITLYQMLTGEVPFDGNTPVEIAKKHIYEPFPLIDNKYKISNNVIKLIYKMTEKKAINRHQTPDELISEINLILKGGLSNVSKEEKKSLKKREIKLLKKKKDFRTLLELIPTYFWIVLFILLLWLLLK